MGHVIQIPARVLPVCFAKVKMGVKHASHVRKYFVLEGGCARKSDEDAPSGLKVDGEAVEAECDIFYIVSLGILVFLIL